MKSFLVLFLVSLSFCVNLRSREYYEYAFETYRRQFNREYVSVDEHMYRMQLFADNIDKIAKHNVDSTSWKMGINSFADMTVEEFKNGRFCGCFNNNKNIKPHNGTRVTKNLRSALSTSIDWEEKGAVAPVKDQGSCGSCWAFSAVGSLESVNYIATGKMTQFSEQQLVDCSTNYGNNGCGGGLMTSAFDYVKDHGLCSEDDYPYTAKDGLCKTKCEAAVHIKDYYNLDEGEAALEEALNTSPVSVAIYADPLMFYSSGIFNDPCGDWLDHGVLAVGYGEEEGKKYWRVKNSWGASWGEKGYFRLIKGIGGYGECGIASMNTVPVV